VVEVVVGRPARIDEHDLLAAVGRLVARDGPSALSTRRIAAEAGVPTGSLYHRFSDRDTVVAGAWLKAVRMFQRGFVEALDETDLDAAVEHAAAHTPRWAIEHPVETALLLRHNRQQLVPTWPGELADALDDVNRPLLQALRRHARRRWGSASGERVDLLRFAVVTVPGAVVREHRDLGPLVAATSAAALAIVRTIR
jgi:AcrR family transcriptional regulator